jgi:hypothetical protein
VRKVTNPEIRAWEHKQRVALLVRIGEATKEEYEQARNDWMEARRKAHSK